MTMNEEPIIQESPQEKLQAVMQKLFLRRRKNISPSVNDGFQTTGTISDSESSASNAS